MSNFSKALDKIIGKEQVGNANDAVSLGSVSDHQRAFEYEDRVTSRRLEASSSIGKKYQPRLYTEREINTLKFITTEEQFREQRAVLEELRNQIADGNAAKGKTILVTSPIDSPSVSVFCRNLGSILVTDESVTALLIDMTGTKESLQLSDSLKQPGVRDFVKSESLSLKEVIYPTGIPRLNIIPTGTGLGSMSELLRTTKMRVLIKDVSRRYRERNTIIIAPSINTVSDVELLNEYADVIVLAVPYSKTMKKDVIRAMGKLDKSKFLGSVILDVTDEIRTPLERLGVL